MINRRMWLKSSTSAVFALPLTTFGQNTAKKLKFGLISDVHKDIIHDADERLTAFVQEMQQSQVQAIMQMGDFCIPKMSNLGFMHIWNQFDGPRFHIIGNHDTDGGYKRSDTVKYYGMPDRYYSFDLHGFHFIVLDANDIPPGHRGGYPSFIGPEQVEWLKDDLNKTELNTFVFSHQSLERPLCIKNQQQVRDIIANAKNSNDKNKVAACFNGHWHIDHIRTIESVPYIHINSASYIWLNDPKYRRNRLSAELSKKYPYVANTIPYTKPVFTVLEIDPANQSFQIKSSESEWMGPGPDTIGYHPDGYDPSMLFPGIRPRLIKY